MLNCGEMSPVEDEVTRPWYKVNRRLLPVKGIYFTSVAGNFHLSRVLLLILHGPSMFAVKAKIHGVLCSIINPALSLLMKRPVIGQRQKAPNFSVFLRSLHGSLVSIGQHFVTTRVTEKDRNKLNYRIGPKPTLSPNRTGLYGPYIAAIAG